MRQNIAIKIFISLHRVCDGMSAVELLFCKPIKLKATAVILFDILNNFMANIQWKKYIGICIDGARTIIWNIPDYTKTCKIYPLSILKHCMIQR